MLHHMLMTRGIDDEAALLQNQGVVDLWLSCRGQEAAQVASAMAVGDTSVIFPSYRVMASDESVVLIGQDIGRLGGVFRVTKGLQDRFGQSRVRDALLAESSIVGQAIGMSLCGLKPICEIQFDGFIYPAMNQIVSQAARITTRWNDDQALNLVIRVPVGGGIRAVEHHSESNEAYFAHTPGLHVAFPSCPTDPARCFSTPAISGRRSFFSSQSACTGSENVNLASSPNQHPPWVPALCAMDRTSPSSGTEQRSKMCSPLRIASLELSKSRSLICAGSHRWTPKQCSHL